MGATRGGRQKAQRGLEEVRRREEDTQQQVRVASKEEREELRKAEKLYLENWEELEGKEGSRLAK